MAFILHRREALYAWKRKLGSDATYQRLMSLNKLTFIIVQKSSEALCVNMKVKKMILVIMMNPYLNQRHIQIYNQHPYHHSISQDVSLHVMNTY